MVPTSAANKETWAHTGGVSLYDQRTWDLLLDTDWWWTSLPPLVFGSEGGRIAYLARSISVHFVTNRKHNRQPAAYQTAVWLRDRLGIPYASVITTKFKGEAALLLKATHSLEDKLENAWCITWMTGDPPCKSYLLDRPYNRTNEPFGPQVQRVQTVADFLTIVEEAI